MPMRVRTSDAPLFSGGAKLTKAPGSYDLCVTKVHAMETRGKFAQLHFETPHLDGCDLASRQ